MVTVDNALDGASGGPGGEAGLMSLVASRSGKGAFKEEAASYIDQLYRVAFHLTKKKEDSDDLVQETYLRAISNYEQFEPGTNLKAWLTRILYNVFVNRYHHDRKTVSIDQSVAGTEASWLDSMPSSAPGPEGGIFTRRA